MEEWTSPGPDTAADPDPKNILVCVIHTAQH